MSDQELDDALEELVSYQEALDLRFPDDDRYPFMKSYKHFLARGKIEEIVKKLIKADERKKEFIIDELVVEESREDLFKKSPVLLEWEQYKGIPKTNLTYRYDKGKGSPGMEDHIHVYLDDNQVYAINRSGTPHDGSRAQLGKKEQRFLKSIGFKVPDGGLLEWITLEDDKNYVAYRRRLLVD
jgi:hypothetical protein